MGGIKGHGQSTTDALGKFCSWSSRDSFTFVKPAVGARPSQVDHRL